MRGENLLGFNVTILLSTFITKVNGTGPLAGHYQLFDSKEPRCKWAKTSWKGEILFRRDGCAYISSSGDAYCFETLGNDEYETRWCFFLLKIFFIFYALMDISLNHSSWYCNTSIWLSVYECTFIIILIFDIFKIIKSKSKHNSIFNRIIDW